MKKKSFVFLGILLFLFSSCIQNPVSGKKVRLINEAGEKIKVLEINPDYKKRLMDNEIYTKKSRNTCFFI